MAASFIKHCMMTVSRYCTTTIRYFINSRKVASRWSERKRSVDVLNVLEDWIMANGKPNKVMHDNGKQFTSRIFRHFLVRNHIRNKRIPNSYPQLQGKIEAYNKIVKNEFLAIEEGIP